MSAKPLDDRAEAGAARSGRELMHMGGEKVAMGDIGSVELVKIEVLNAVQVFTGGGMNAILDRIEAQVRAIPLDPSTASGRDGIRSVAYRVARTKTALDAEGKKLTEEWRKNTALVNAERKKSTERLDLLAEEVRQPLTEFENKEKIRVAAHEAALAEIAGLWAMIQDRPGMTAALLHDNLLRLSELHKERPWEEFADRARKLRAEASVELMGRIEAQKKFEADQAELARLRQEEAERLQRKRDERLKAEAAEAARLEATRKAQVAAETERRRVAAEAEAVRLEHERFRRESEAREAKAESDRVAAESLAERNRRAEEQKRFDAEKRAQNAEDARKAMLAKAKRDQEAAIQRERERVEALRRQAECERIARETDDANKAAIHAEIVTDLNIFCAQGLGTASGIADAIMAGKIRHVKVAY